MSPEADKLEHLFSRAIDGEASAADRELLAALLKSDARMQALFNEYRSLDRAAGEALRQAAGRRPRVVTLGGFWRRSGRTLLVAAAAGLAAVLWLQPMEQHWDGRAETAPQQAGSVSMPSWFVPSVPRGDVIEPVPTAYERPELRVRGTERNWLLIPGDRPGEFFVIEANRVRTHVIVVQQDF